MGGAAGGSAWEAGGGLNPLLGLLGLFGLAMVPKKGSHRPKNVHLNGVYNRRFPITGENFRSMPSM